MKTIIIASKNKGKIKEFQEMLGYEVDVQSLLDKPFADIEETGETFAKNAALKAEAVRDAWGCMTIADDSGLEVDALSGRPGIYSARYAGDKKDDEMNIKKVLEELEGVPENERTARFVCVIAVAAKEKTHFFKGICEGRISLTKRGDQGFGYDPIFFVPDKNKTMAELSPKEKNTISHRYHALKQLQQSWKDFF